MAANDPINRQEVELRLENVEQRLENKLDRVLLAIEIQGQEIKNVKSDIENVKERVGDLRGLIATTGVGLLLVLLGFIFPIAWQLWVNMVHWPAK